MAEQTALVMLAPDDSIDSIIQQVKNTGATHVDLLMPDGAPALQSRKSCDKLREAANRSDIELTFYTADPKIVKAAQTCQIMVVELDETALQPASASATVRPATPVAPAAPAITSQPRSLEEDFLASLESLPTAPSTTSPRRGADTIVVEPPAFAAQQPEDDWASALDSLSIAAVGGEAALRDHEKSLGNEWDFDGFNDLSDVLGGGEPSSAAPSRPRIRAEDIELTKDDMNRQLSKAKRDKLDKPPRRGLFGRGGATAATSMEILPENPQQRSWTRLLVGLLLVGLLLFGIWWLFFRNPATTITVSPPAQRAGVETYDDVRINYQSEALNDPSSAAILGRAIQSPVSVTVRGTVLEATSQPDKSAGGTIQIINRNTVDFPLAANTRVTTTNPQGQSVNYLITQDVVVPAAVVNPLAGVQFSRIDAPVTAVAPGEQYNLPPNENTAWVVEGYEESLLGINIQPIEGGTNILLKIPTENDIRPLLNQAVPLFRQAVPEQLKAQLQAGEEVAGIAFTPNIDEIAQNPLLYDMQTRPIPETDGDFELILTANFRGLAVPTQPSFAEQLARALPNALRIKAPTFNQETTDIVSNSLQLSDDTNANLLLATVVTAPKATDQAISSAAQAEMATALQGLSIQDARLKLEEFYQRGLIGPSYTLPEVEKLPDDAAQIRIVVQ